jgi:hypothetical protein
VHLKDLLSSECVITQRIAKGLEWIQSTLGPGLVDERIEAQIKLRGKTVVEMFDTISPGAKADLLRMAPVQLPCVLLRPAALGGRVELLEGVPGTVERLREVADGRGRFREDAVRASGSRKLRSRRLGAGTPEGLGSRKDARHPCYGCR